MMLVQAACSRVGDDLLQMPSDLFQDLVLGVGLEPQARLDLAQHVVDGHRGTPTPILPARATAPCSRQTPATASARPRAAACRPPWARRSCGAGFPARLPTRSARARRAPSGAGA